MLDKKYQHFSVWYCDKAMNIFTFMIKEWSGGLCLNKRIVEIHPRQCFLNTVALCPAASQDFK